MSWNILNTNVVRWAEERGIFVGSDPTTQFLKFIEETGETAAAILKDNQGEFVDGVGDVLVTLILLCHMRSVTLEECLEEAWNEIKDRKGRMVNGAFVKNADFTTGGEM